MVYITIEPFIAINDYQLYQPLNSHDSTIKFYDQLWLTFQEAPVKFHNIINPNLPLPSGKLTCGELTIRRSLPRITADFPHLC